MGKMKTWVIFPTCSTFFGVFHLLLAVAELAPKVKCQPEPQVIKRVCGESMLLICFIGKSLALFREDYLALSDSEPGALKEREDAGIQRRSSVFLGCHCNLTCIYVG
ncbi:hypothetical protein F4818DRAFT_76116 [Hypoxylon cercidicola]|nr:hypothetical protein F4818DRAFT_76116 [Hypoxylon cercidicola]